MAEWVYNPAGEKGDDIAVTLRQPEELEVLGCDMEAWAGHLDWSSRVEADLLADGITPDKLIIAAFRKIRRFDFLPANQATAEGHNGPLEIGYGQTNSQPLVVARMLHLLKPRPGNRVLELGAGSGWAVALIGAIVRKRGSVVGTEVIKGLVEFGNSNLRKYDLPQANIIHTPDELGHPAGRPYHRLLVSARIPYEWLPHLTDQLHPRGGRLVVPASSMADYEVGGETQELLVITRHGSDYTRETARRGVHFVPTVWHPTVQ